MKEENSDEQTTQLSENEALYNEFSKREPVGDLQSLESLEIEYTSENFVSKNVKSLRNSYAKWRPIRGDGDCFPRCFAFGLAEYQILNAPKSKSLALHVVQNIENVRDSILARHGEYFLDFYEVTYNLFSRIAREEESVSTLEHFFRSSVGNYIVQFFRYLTSDYLLTHTQNYEVFLPEEITMDVFCQNEVNIPGRDFDHVQILALCKSIGVGIRIVYADNSPTLNSYVVPEGVPTVLNLLYRPGHYDLLYP